MVNTLKRWWGRLGSHSFGRYLFSRMLGFMIPYTGTIKPRVIELRHGFARISIKDKRALSNHLSSIHALALANLGELTTGLALHFALREQDRAILTKLEVEYHKKARGPIFSKAEVDPSLNLSGPIVVRALLYDQNQALVCTVNATWLVRPI